MLKQMWEGVLMVLFKGRPEIHLKDILGTARCWDCKKPIVPSDDDAMVCIDCGGRNRRLAQSEARLGA